MTDSLLSSCVQSPIASVAVSMMSVALLVFCMSSLTHASFTHPVIEYDHWVAMNETANKLPAPHVSTQRSDDEEENILQVLRQTYQSSSGYGAPAADPEDCYLETGCSSSCGEGFRLLLPNKQAASCVSSVLQVLPCKEKECPLDCSWDLWSPWAQCAQRSKRKARSLSRIFQNNDDFTYVSEESYERVPEKRQTSYGSPSSDRTFPSCSQSRVRGVSRPAENGGRQCRGDRAEERYCRSSQCRGRLQL